MTLPLRHGRRRICKFRRTIYELTVRLPTEQQHFHVRHQVCFPVAEQATGKRCSHVTPAHNCYEDQVRIDIRHFPPLCHIFKGGSSGEVNVRPSGGVVVGKW